MSCSVHDVIRFEKKGIPTVNIGTDAFTDESEEQSRLLGMPDYNPVWVAHPVAILTTEQIQTLARDAASRIVERLVAQ